MTDGVKKGCHPNRGYVFDFGLLRMCGVFVNLDFLLVILDIFRVMHES